MICRLTLAAAFAISATASFAQDSTGPSVPVVSEDFVIGADLISNDEKYTLTQDPRYDITNDEDVYVIETGDVKATGAWTAADSAACEASGGIELPISAGRTACFKL